MDNMNCSVNVDVASPNKNTCEVNGKLPNGKNTSLKRPLEEPLNENVAKKLKKINLTTINTLNKSPVAILNEIKQGLKYDLISQSGPTHAPTFIYKVELDGEVYTGEGRNKKLAKAAAAEKALKSFIQFPHPKSASAVAAQKVGENLDFTSDDIVEEAPKNDTDSLMPTAKIPSTITKGPVMLLNEMYPGLKYECQTMSDAIAKFKVVLELKGEKFFGTGGSKKNAKAAAARAALSKICNMAPSAFLAEPSNLPIHTNTKSALPQQLADRIGELVLTKFEELLSADPIHAKRKVIAGIVMTQGYIVNSTKLICLATGTKCISGEHISEQGAAINDTHAEIVSRRCLIDFLYSQLEVFSKHGTKRDSIFTPRPGGGYQLKSNIKFHLYINTAPCGDARIFSPHERSTEDGTDKHPNRKARGQLRTKIESGEGTIPVASSEGIQTWDGVLQGERLLTMSCSDKICRWNVLGLQGALLTNFIEPIYLDSIVLGSLLHPEHMTRAIYGRIESTIQGLPPPFKLNKPNTSLLTSLESRRATKAPNFSANWTAGLSEAEVISSPTGKTEFGAMSRICKQMFFRRYLNLLGNISSINNIGPPNGSMMYYQAKMTAGDYQIAKKQLFTAFQKSYLGAWLKKPIEQDQFEL